MASTTQSLSSRRRNRKAVGATALAGALILGGSLAYFTDHETASAKATAGTVDLTLTEAWADVSNFNPGDQADFSYQISNSGNKSIDVRETIVLKSSEPMDAAAQAEFELYHASDIQQAANGSYVPKADAQPIATGADRVVSADSTSIKYIIDEYTLNGTGANAETESGVSATSKDSDYVLIFRDTSGNAFQGAQLSVDLLAEAKQHRNTDGDTWATVATEAVTIGGESVQAVPVR